MDKIDELIEKVEKGLPNKRIIVREGNGAFSTRHIHSLTRVCRELKKLKTCDCEGLGRMGGTLPCNQCEIWERAIQIAGGKKS